MHTVVSFERGHPALLRKNGIKFPVDGWGLPGHAGANKPLKAEEFCRCLLPKVRAAAAARRGEPYDGKAGRARTGCARWLCCCRCERSCCDAEQAFNKSLCEDIFRIIDRDRNQVLSIDEIYNYILHYTKDTDDDGVKTDGADDSDSESDADGDGSEAEDQDEEGAPH